MQLWQFTRDMHVSWLIAVASGSIVVGVALVPQVGQVWFGSFVWLLVGLALIVIVCWQRAVYLIPLIIIGGLLVGLWRGSIADKELWAYEKLHGHSMTISGSVTDDADKGKSGEQLLRLGEIVANGHELAGSVWVSLQSDAEIKRSDTVTLDGKLTPGFGSFAASMYRAKLVKVERAEPGDVALQVRDGFGDNVRQAIGEPQASLGLGYLVGQRRALPPELDQALVIAGLTHIVVASGYNLTILVRFARRLFVRVSKYLATLAAGGMTFGFIAITGASPSMTRAGLVTGLSLAAWYYGRRLHPLVLLPFAAAITVLINPAFAWNDLGWQLSFAAFGGVMILAPLLQNYLYGAKKPGTIRQIVGETMAASIVTLPILVLAFGQFSNVALLANVLVLPFVPLAMLLTFVAGIGVMIAPFVAEIVGLPAEWLLGYMTAVAQYLAELPWAQTTLAVQPWMAWAAYALIAALCIWLWRATKHDLRDSNIVE